MKQFLFTNKDFPQIPTGTQLRQRIDVQRDIQALLISIVKIIQKSKRCRHSQSATQQEDAESSLGKFKPAIHNT